MLLEAQADRQQRPTPIGQAAARWRKRRRTDSAEAVRGHNGFPAPEKPAHLRRRAACSLKGAGVEEDA